jgi:hypothetical protein
MSREPSDTDPSQEWWKAFLQWVKSFDYSSYDYLADRVSTLEEELAQLKRTQGSGLPPTPASDRENRSSSSKGLRPEIVIGSPSRSKTPYEV